MPKLTEDTVAALVTGDRDTVVSDSQIAGFGVRLTRAGRKIFVARASVRGRRRWVTLGYHPDMTVTAARVDAMQALADMKRGTDPVVARKARERATAAGQLTVAALTARWLTEHVRPKLKP